MTGVSAVGNMPSMVKTQIYLPKGKLNPLHRVAKAKKRSFAELVRRAIRRSIRAHVQRGQLPYEPARSRHLPAIATQRLTRDGAVIVSGPSPVTSPTFPLTPPSALFHSGSAVPPPNPAAIGVPLRG